MADKEKMEVKAAPPPAKPKPFWKRAWAKGCAFIDGILFERKEGQVQMMGSIGRILLIATVGWMFWWWTEWATAATITARDVVELMKTEGLVLTPQLEAEQVHRAVERIILKLPPRDSMPPGLKEAFYTFAGYVFGTKGLDVIKNVAGRFGKKTPS